MDGMHAESMEMVAGWLREAERVVAFTGAGISTESGIPDFRSPGGVWATNKPVYYDEFLNSVDARREYWRQKSLTHVEFARSKPNEGHTVLAEWERDGLLQAVVTQNIDGLHQQAGSQRVLELHGTARNVACLSCDFVSPADEWVERFIAEGESPLCPSCDGLLKHATVSFGQGLPEDVMQESIDLARTSHVFLAIGSSLVVEPAASLPRVAKRTGGRLVILNRDPTPLDEIADLVVPAEIGNFLRGVADRTK